ncbi:hypothetical protein LCGC14_2122130 [marine sediment metagenome]|uniref:Uncharacterized protein n=1 Tax=marine sediment metagenome TaxID=412755 RepID=A0A0F9GH09_9ZZZZ
MEKKWFEYHCLESEKSTDAILWHHTHQEVTVLNKIPPSESDLEMYMVRFKDGLEYSVFADELVNSVKDFYRPDYKTPKK